MTYREFYTLVSAGTLTDEVKAFALSAVASLDGKKEKRKVSPSAQRAQKERDAFRALVLDCLTAQLQTSAQVAELVGESTAKTAAALSALVEDGKVKVEEFKPTGKGRKVRGYALMKKEGE